MCSSDLDLTELTRFHVVTNVAAHTWRKDLDETVRTMHDASGLWDESRSFGLPLDQVSDRLTSFLRRDRFVGDWTVYGSVLAGSSVYWDKGMLAKKFPWTANVFNYRLLDVSTFHETAKRFWPHIAAGAPAKRDLHRVLPDLEDSMNYLRYYLEALKKGAR